MSNATDEKSITPVFRLIMMCSMMPKIPDDQYTVWRRIKIVDFNSRWDGELLTRKRTNCYNNTLNKRVKTCT